jgi:ABC-type multidrug transport system ATPase subunit
VAADPVAAKRLLGVVPQHNTLDRQVSAFENLYLHCRYYVDAHIALLVQAEGTVVSSDEADIAALLQTRKVKAVIVDA